MYKLLECSQLQVQNKEKKKRKKNICKSKFFLKLFGNS